MAKGVFFEMDAKYKELASKCITEIYNEKGYNHSVVSEDEIRQLLKNKAADQYIEKQD